MKKQIFTSNKLKLTISFTTESFSILSYPHSISGFTMIEIPSYYCVAGSDWEDLIRREIANIMTPEKCEETGILEEIVKKIKAHIYSAIF